MIYLSKDRQSIIINVDNNNKLNQNMSKRVDIKPWQQARVKIYLHRWNAQRKNN